MTILGIDPGLNATGFGVIRSDDGRIQLITAGALRPSPRQPLAKRLLELYEGLSRVIKTTQPALAVLEGLYTHHAYLTTATLMAHARGVACLVSSQHGLQVVEYLPTRVKKALTGNGGASKEQVARMVETWLRTRDPAWSSDATDALALAIAHAQISRSPLGPSLETARRNRRRPLIAAASGAQG